MSTPHPCHRTLLGAALLCAPAALAAQEAPDTARLPAIQVTSSVLPVAGAATGSGIGARVTLLDTTALRRFAPRTLAAVLAGQPGVALYDDLGSPVKPTVVLRGFTVSGVVGLPQGVTVFVDGVPVNEPDAGQVNLDLLPLRHARQVELLGGTASLLGPNSLAGAINIVTEHGGGPARGELSLSAGSHGQRAATANAAGRIGAVSYYAGADVAREGGWRQLTAGELGQLFVNVGRFGARRGVGLQVSVAQSRAETAGSLPESVYDVRPDSNLSAGDFEDLRQVHVALSGYLPALGGRTALRAWARTHDAERFNVNQVDDPDVRGFSRNRSVGAHADWHRAFVVGDAALDVRAGAGGSAHAAAIRLFAERIAPGLTTDVESPIRKADAFVLGGYTRGPVTVTLGARYDVVRVPFRNLLRPERDTTSTFHHVSPRGGVSVALGRDLSLFASAGQGFRAPAVIELACADPEEPCPLPFALGDDPPLAPVVATTFETGVRWARSAWAVDGAVYRTHVRNDIFLHPYHDESEPEGSTIDGYFANIPRTQREGVELAASGRIGEALSLRGAYGYSRATFRTTAEIFSIREAAGEENEVEPGDRLPLVPDHTLTGEATLHVVPGATLAARTRHVGRRWFRGDEANVTRPLAAHTVTDLHAAVTRGRWTIAGAVTNVFESRHAAFGTFNINQGAGGVLERFLTPAAPRGVHVTFTRTFGG